MAELFFRDIELIQIDYFEELLFAESAITILIDDGEGVEQPSLWILFIHIISEDGDKLLELNALIAILIELFKDVCYLVIG